MFLAYDPAVLVHTSIAAVVSCTIYQTCLCTVQDQSPLT
jgi:hypothetical protein